MGAANISSNMERDSSPISGNVPRTVFPEVHYTGSKQQSMSDKLTSENVYKAFNVKDRQSAQSNLKNDEKPKLRIKGLTD